MVLGLGFVSLFIDMVSDGAIAVGGALLQQLGGSATLAGVVTGAATAIALVLRLVTGPWVDRTGGYWGSTKQTAMAIYGLLAFMRARGETAQPFSVDVFVNGALAGRR